MILRKLYAFLWRDWQQARSYRLSFAMQTVGLAVPLVSLYFMGRLFNQVDVSPVDEYGGNYPAFALVGVIIVGYSGTALRSFTGALRSAQVTGTLEILVLTPTSLPTMMFGWSLYPFLRSTLFLFVAMFGGLFILGLSFAGANVISAVVTVLLTITVMGSLGIVAASFTLVFKQGDPFTAIIVLASGMLSGTLYPVGILPAWLQGVAQMLPQTHAIEAMRLAVLQGQTVPELAPRLGALAIYAAILVPIGIFTLRKAMHQARIDGSLAHY